MKLVDVYSVWGTVIHKDAPLVLYNLLKQRTPEQNISHKVMPTWEQHRAFIESRPYLAWYLIEVDAEFVGAIYLSKQLEIGIFISEFSRGSGYGAQAVRMLREKHPGRVYANINPDNWRSQQFFVQQGFSQLQVTYVSDTDKPLPESCTPASRPLASEGTDAI